MKKLLLVLAIGAFAACNDNSSENDSMNADTMAPSTVDSTTMSPMDTTSTMSDSSAVRPDSATTR